ncbi:MAG TPA: YncE family protein, partial [Ureibacillus sp.]|nr:YncE family protein [Ureibacillus sp.]
MRRGLLILIFLCIYILVGCSEEKLPSIKQQQSFIASMNILEPSLSFFDESGDPIAKWAFDKEYTGALLIQHDRVLLYGHKLADADIYELSTGKLLTSIQTGLGSTNAYYDSEYQRIFITNSETNSVLSYDQQGNKIGETPIGNYPMSMASNDGLLY